MNTSRRGAIVWIFCLQYFAAEAIAILGWRGSYSLSRNFISDLGAVNCDTGSAAAVCSPLHPLMNASFLLQGVLILVGAVLVWRLFPRGWLWALALGLIGASGLGVFVVGLAPEDAAPGWHYLGAAENFLFCNSGAALLGAALLRAGGTAKRMGGVTLIAGLIGLAGLVCLAKQIYLGLGVGGMERVTAYPFPLWIASMGWWLLRGGDPYGLSGPAEAARLAAMK